MAGSETRIKTTTTTFRLSPEERADVEAVANDLGIGPSSFARLSTLQAAGRHVSVRKRRNVTAAVVAPLLAELGRIGNNLNQLARHKNRGGSVADSEFASMRAEFERLSREVMRLRE